MVHQYNQRIVANKGGDERPKGVIYARRKTRNKKNPTITGEFNFPCIIYFRYLTEPFIVKFQCPKPRRNKKKKLHIYSTNLPYII